MPIVSRAGMAPAMLSASSSDSEGHARQTPKKKRAPGQPSSPINERKALRKNRRHRIQYAVIEGNNHIEAGADASELVAASGSTDEGRRKIAKVDLVDRAHAFADATTKLAPGFAEDFFLGHGHAKLNRTLCANSMAAVPAAEITAEEHIPPEGQFPCWLRLLRRGFSVLVQGIGSKKQLLQDFADKSLKPAGLRVVNMNAFDARFSLQLCLKGILEQVYPDVSRTANSADALVAAIRSQVASPETKPLCIVVHSLENLPKHHMIALASLAASPGCHLVASIDSIWSSLSWDCRCLKDFNFAFKEVQSFAGYEVEATARHPRGLPPWCGLGVDKRRTPKASLNLVMKSLTNNHRELVEAMAEEQLEAENSAGISIPALLKVSTDRLIALSVPKLKGLLKELIDHEVVVQRGCSSSVTSQALFALPFDEHTLQQLMNGEALDSDAEQGDGGPGDDGADEEVMA